MMMDHLGSTNMVTDSSGTPLEARSYKAFGETASQSGAVSTDTRYCTAIATGYTGQRQEPELGLYYYNARWYDPYLARFTQPDTIVPNPTDAKAFDRYAYVNNNPVMYSDPSGHEPACYDRNGSLIGFLGNAECWANEGTNAGQNDTELYGGAYLILSQMELDEILNALSRDIEALRAISRMLMAQKLNAEISASDAETIYQLEVDLALDYSLYAENSVGASGCLSGEVELGEGIQASGGAEICGEQSGVTGGSVSGKSAAKQQRLKEISEIIADEKQRINAVPQNLLLN
jgi:RHS repeat-associated protein